MLERLGPLLRGAARRWWRHTAGTAPAGPPPARRSEPTPEALDELAFWSPAGRTRADLLGALLAAGWQPAGEHSAWDLMRGGLRLLAATEVSAGPGRLTRVRLGGPERELAGALAAVRALGCERLGDECGG
jgi:hypothetical protein